MPREAGKIPRRGRPPKDVTEGDGEAGRNGDESATA
jgi:hypothetical protein